MIDRMNGIEKDEEEIEDEKQDGASPSRYGRRMGDIGTQSRSSNIWVISFTDIMALMLTFFVLLYAMSNPESQDWDEMSSAMKNEFSVFEGPVFDLGPEDAISIEKIDFNQALNLDYLSALLEPLLEEEETLVGVRVIPQYGRLVVSLPQDLLFEPGRADISEDGSRALFTLGGRLHRIKNRIEIIGHTDPRPIQESGGRYGSNWELSLARATSVAAALYDVGYDRQMTVRGLSSAYFDELSTDIPEDTRLDLSRRVDIVIMEDDGRRVKFTDLGVQ